MYQGINERRRFSDKLWQLLSEKQMIRTLYLLIFQYLKNIEMGTSMVHLIYTLVIIFLLGLFSANAQLASFQVLSTPIAINQSISICFASCQSCKDGTDLCETCFEPFFEKDENGVCVVSNDQTYVQQSTEQERRATTRIPSSSWISRSGQIPNRLCSSKDINGNQVFQYNITGMFQNDKLNYRRTISQHDYFGMKFFVVLSNWCPNCRLGIRVQNQSGIILASYNLTSQNPRVILAQKEDLCNDEGLKSDQRFSFALTINERNSRQLALIFEGSTLGSNASWGVGTFALITGRCNSSCETCDGFTSNINTCTSCKNFLIDTDAQKCSSCLSGFYKNIQLGCSKCNIRFATCLLEGGIQVPQVCRYESLTNVQQNCTFNQNPEYIDQTLIENEIFFSSLFSIEGQGAVTRQCGQYSIVGPARLGQFISRTFLNMPPHLQISLNFNIFVIDQDFGRTYTVVIRIDGQVVPIDRNAEIISITGSSNECGRYDKVQGMATFSTPRFIQHDKSDNVKIEIGLGTANGESYSFWGLRDFRVSYRSCDADCLNCTAEGCLQCKNNLVLNNLRCDGCPGGAGIIKTSDDFCDTCPSNCLTCKIESGRKTCTQCVLGYYLFEIENSVTCEKDPNYYDPIKGDNGWSGTISSSCTAKFYNGVITTAEGQTLKQSSSKQFIVGQQRMVRKFQTSKETNKKKISFYLLKIDNWEDLFLDMYVNDLLVLHRSFNNTGNQICENPDENDQFSYEEFILEDKNTTTTVEFEVVDPTFWTKRDLNFSEVPRTAKFGISEFQVHEIGCAECQNQDFNFKIKYNYDKTLKVHMEFNRIYENNDPVDFKNTFQVQIEGSKVDYEIIFNDSIRYILETNIQQEIMNKSLEVICKYPKRVTTNLNTEENIETFFVAARRNLQNSTIDPYDTSKTLDNGKSMIEVSRFTPLKNRVSALEGVATFFAIVSRLVIYLGLASFFIGCQTPCTHMMHNLQKIWLHIFVASLALSPLLKTSLLGFREIQDQNIAINPKVWENGLPQYLYYDTYAPFQQYYQDINFWRNIYSIGVACLILIFVYIVMRVFLPKLQSRFSPNNIAMRHLKFSFVERPLWYLNSVIFYQYLTVAMACCFQFLDISNGVSIIKGFDGITAAAAIIAFILITVYPIIFHFYLSKVKSQALGLDNMDQVIKAPSEDIITQNFKYTNKYGEIFYRFLPRYVWETEGTQLESIGERQFFYNVLRYGELWWYSVLIILLYWNPFAQAFLLMLTTIAHLIVVLFFRLSYTNTFRILKCLEMLLFLGLEIIILVFQELRFTLRTDSYETLGIVSIALIFGIILLSFLRLLYTGKKIYSEYKSENLFMRRSPAEYGEFV